MRKFLVRLVIAVLAAGALQACAASYKTRMAHLDLTAQRGLDYRAKLVKQGTQPSREACTTGYDLVDDNVPDDVEAGGESDTWRKQVAEAFIKSCMTGQPRPKPEPSGVDAVSAVPVTPLAPVSSAPRSP